MHPLLDPAMRPVFGHRGNAAHAPENTLESFREAVALGVDGIELDVRMTADDHVVVLHDPTVERTTDGTGPVAGMRLAEAQALDAGARFGTVGAIAARWKGRGVTIPTLDQVLLEFPDLPLLIEIKSGDASTGTRQLIERHRAEDRCVVASFDDRALLPFRDSKIRLGSSRRDIARCLVPARLGITIRAPRFHAMCIPRAFRGMPLPVAAFARSLLPSGVLVHVWTVDDPRVARQLWQAGVRGIISNDPGTILAERRRMFGDSAGNGDSEAIGTARRTDA